MAGFTMPRSDLSSGFNALNAGLGQVFERQQQNRLGALLPQAYAGDQNALNQLAQLDPRAYGQVQNQNFERSRLAAADKSTADTARRALVRQGLTDAAGTIVNLPDEQQATAWPTIRQRLVTDYPELAPNLPEQYGPEVKATAMGLAGIKPLQEKPVGPTDDIQEFQFARQNGFSGEFQDWMKLKTTSAAGASPYFQAVPTPQGYMRFNARSGQMEPIMVNGAVPQPIAADPNLKRDMEQAGAQGRTIGEAQAEGALTAPQAVARADQILADIDNTLSAPGLDTATGMSGAVDPRNYIPGTNARDARVRIEQVQGQAFLQAFESLKGGGAITEREGQAATAAFARLNRAQSDAEFRGALGELKTIIGAARGRAARKGAAVPGVSLQQAPGVAQPVAPSRPPLSSFGG